MAKTGTITMSMKEADRLKIIAAVVDGNLKPNQAAERLELTTRQVRRLVLRYEAEGAAGLVSRKRGRPGNHQLSDGVADWALSLIRQRYADFGPTLACEKLREGHGLCLGVETIRQLMMEAGLWIPRRLRDRSVYQPRNRRHCVGELIQIDGSDHRWFEDRAAPCTLLVFIDDATSRLMHLHFTYSESTFSYFEATRRYIELHGKPQAFYSDQYSVFRVARKQACTAAGYTQFGRALYELNIQSICANSSQAKGRVERANLTLQDRLVKELRLQGISTMENANAFVPAFIADYNRRFAKPPRSDTDVHRAVRQDEELDLIFTYRELRKVSHALTLQYDHTMYLLADIPSHRRLIGKYIEVTEYPDGRIEPRHDGCPLPCVAYDRLPDIDQAAIVENKRLAHVLQIVQLVQQQRDSRRGQAFPSRTNRGVPTAQKQSEPGKKPQRQLSSDDITQAMAQVAPLAKPSKKQSPSAKKRTFQHGRQSDI